MIRAITIFALVVLAGSAVAAPPAGYPASVTLRDTTSSGASDQYLGWVDGTSSYRDPSGTYELMDDGSGAWQLADYATGVSHGGLVWDGVDSALTWDETTGGAGGSVGSVSFAPAPVPTSQPWTTRDVVEVKALVAEVFGFLAFWLLMLSWSKRSVFG